MVLSSCCESDPKKQQFLKICHKTDAKVPIIGDCALFRKALEQPGGLDSIVDIDGRTHSRNSLQSDLLVAGYSCKDFSPEKQNKPTNVIRDAVGTSGTTFDGGVDAC